MRNVIFLTLLSFVLISACGNKKVKMESDSTPVHDAEEALSSDDLKKADNCDEFIDQYEKWMDDYLKLLEKYMKNPMNATLTQQYLNLSQEAIKWSEQWGKLAECSAKEKYRKRFDEISEKAEKKMKELGLE